MKHFIRILGITLMLLWSAPSFAEMSAPDIELINQSSAGGMAIYAIMVPGENVENDPSAVTQFWTTNTTEGDPLPPVVTDFHGGDLIGYCAGEFVLYNGDEGYADMSVQNYVETVRWGTIHLSKWDVDGRVYMYCPDPYPQCNWFIGVYDYLTTNIQRLRQSHDIAWEAQASSPFGTGSGGSVFTVHPGP